VSERLVHVHLIEPGRRSPNALFDVSLLLDAPTRDLLSKGHPDVWRAAISRCQRLIREHLAGPADEEG
jgi:hypothetical protein